jgi:hypothetical protein
MSDRLTSIGPRAEYRRTESGVVIVGMSVYGRETRVEMIRQYRAAKQRDLEEAQAALALTDEQLIVKTYVGAWARKNEQEVTE